MSDGVLTKLRAGTSAAHTSLENYVDMPRRAADSRMYRRLLECFLGWYEPLEEQLRGAGNWEDTGYSPEERSKVGWIAHDLASLGLSAQEIAALPRCSDVPRCPSLARAFGCAYVMEGATLGGRVISGMLKDRVPEDARTFFRAHGEKTRERWLEFIGALETFSGKHNDDAATVEAAKESFASLERWLRLRDKSGEALIDA